MGRSEYVVFVSAGMLAPKKRDHALARRQLYLNYGALTLATLLEHHGYSTRLIHGEHDAPADFLEKLYEQGLLPSKFPIMLSMPSFYALAWARNFCVLAKQRDPNCRIVVGGRWVVGPDPDWLQTKIPDADLMVPGLGEETILGLLRMERAVTPPSAVGKLPSFPLNHRLVQNHLAYQPSLETSRGCGMGCAFCEERDIRLSGLRPPGELAAYMAATVEQYDGGNIRPYFQSSFFMPSAAWASGLAKATADRGFNVQWRCETRVDAMGPETVAHLAEAGLKVIDLGLETASPDQLRAMTKTQDVDRYLRKASDLLHACKQNGIWVKANVLLYAGETNKTLGETRAWLDQHADAIKGVSVGPVIAFGPPLHSKPMLEEFERLGARPVDRSEAEDLGLSHIHPSCEIDALGAEEISLNLSRRYMDADAYFDLKAFSYYPRNYDRTAFDADVSASDPILLPFSMGKQRGKPSLTTA